MATQFLNERKLFGSRSQTIEPKSSAGDGGDLLLRPIFELEVGNDESREAWWISFSQLSIGLTNWNRLENWLLIVFDRNLQLNRLNRANRLPGYNQKIKKL